MTFYSSLLICLLLFPLVLHATETDNGSVQRGADIAAEAKRRTAGFIDSQESYTMTLRDKKGRERTRRIRMRSFEQANDGDWSLTIFDEPADVKGTAFLVYTHGLEPDDQWIYLPALKRVKRISSRNRSGNFMGSEFAFEDMSSFEMEKYRYRYLRDEICGQLECYVSEWVPAYMHSGYSRMEVWHDQQEYRIQNIKYYDMEGRHFKTLSMTEYTLFSDRFWRPLVWRMSNIENGRTTVLHYDSIEFGVGLTKRDFDKNALKSAR